MKVGKEIRIVNCQEEKIAFLELTGPLIILTSYFKPDFNHLNT